MLDEIFKIQIPEDCQSGRRYAIDILLSDFLGLEYELEVVPLSSTVKISGDNKAISISDCFFKQAKTAWLLPETMPTLPLSTWDISNDIDSANTVNMNIPVICGEKVTGETYVKYDSTEILLGLDVIGSTFFMLSRYEEYVVSHRDNHGRFSAYSSIAYKEKFLDRPIINEYLEILWACMKKLWPGIKRKQRFSNLFLTHDVDRPFYYLYKTPVQAAISYAGDLLKRKSIGLANKKFSDWFWIKKGKVERDPFYKFDYLMDASDRHGVKSAFYFLADRSGEAVDADYEIDSYPIKNLLVAINNRGHEIGLHGSYYSFDSRERLLNEKQRLESVLELAGIQQNIRGLRQHYLRWDTAVTPSIIDSLDIEYDSTLSYADYSGFRCGVCFRFPIYDLKNDKPLNIYERPLIIMECSVLDNTYMGLDNSEEAFNYIVKLYDRCRLFDGEFVILWHNSMFRTKEDQNLYEQIISY